MSAGRSERRAPRRGRCAHWAPAGSAGQLAVLGSWRRRPDEQPGPAGVGVLEVLQRRGGVGRRGDGDGVGDRTEGGGERDLEPGADVDQLWRRCRARRGAAPEQVAGAVLAGQRQRERVATGRPGRAVALGLRAPATCRAVSASCASASARRHDLVPLVEVDLALVQAADLRLERLELGLWRGPAGRGPRSSAASSRPISASAAVARERSAPTWPVSFARPSRRSAIACRASDQRALLGGQRHLGVGAAQDGRLEPLRVLAHLLGELHLLLADGSGFLLQLLGVAARRGPPRAARRSGGGAARRPGSRCRAAAPRARTAGTRSPAPG